MPQPSLNAMDLDDLIIPSSMGHADSPPEEELSMPGGDGSGIPIRSRKSQQYSMSSGFAPASVPNHPQEFQRSEEFGYVQRRVRKTSIDERMVSRDYYSFVCLLYQSTFLPSALDSYHHYLHQTCGITHLVIFLISLYLFPFPPFLVGFFFSCIVSIETSY